MRVNYSAQYKTSSHQQHSVYDKHPDMEIRISPTHAYINMYGYLPETREPLDRTRTPDYAHFNVQCSFCNLQLRSPACTDASHAFTENGSSDIVALSLGPDLVQSSPVSNNLYTLSGYSLMSWGDQSKVDMSVAVNLCSFFCSARTCAACLHGGYWHSETRV